MLVRVAVMTVVVIAVIGDNCLRGAQVDSHLLLEDPRLLSMGFPQAISHICIMGAEMSLDEGPSLKVFVNNYLICDFDVIATGIFADANGGVGVYGRSSGHAPIVSFQVQLR